MKGAFTGATTNRVGLLEEASGGTLFLDEIAEMSPALQAKLLHVIESGTVRAVGANNERPVDVRIVAATHRDLRARVTEGTFREDLLYRLDVITIELPALRHRREDVPALVQHFLAEAKAKNPQSRATRLTPEALEKLLLHEWPGNVRELQHVVERAVILARAEDIGAGDLPTTVTTAPSSTQTPFRGAVIPMRELQQRYAAWGVRTAGRPQGPHRRDPGHRLPHALQAAGETRRLEQTGAFVDDINQLPWAIGVHRAPTARAGRPATWRRRCVYTASDHAGGFGGLATAPGAPRRGDSRPTPAGTGSCRRRSVP